MKNLKLYGPFLWMGFKCLKATWQLQRDGLIFATQSPGILDTHLINFARMKSTQQI